jgi:hypothetical protein
MFRRLFALGGIALASATMALSGPLSTRAEETPSSPISDVLVFAGNATIQSDTGCVGAEPVVAGDTPAVDLSGGCGHFTFNSDIACAGWSDLTEVDTCNINANGDYFSLSCGTGDIVGHGVGGALTGGATVTSGPNGDDANANFNILFAAGIGVIQGNITSTSPDGGPKVADGTEPIVGAVLITAPTNVTNLTNTVNHSVLGPGRGEDCVTGFTAVGGILAIEGGTS